MLMLLRSGLVNFRPVAVDVRIYEFLLCLAAGIGGAKSDILDRLKGMTPHER